MQFTLYRLLASTAMIACGIAGATLPWRVGKEELANYPTLSSMPLVVFFWSSGAIAGAGIGLLFGRPWLGAILGCLTTMPLLHALLLVCWVV